MNFGWEDWEFVMAWKIWRAKMVLLTLIIKPGKIGVKVVLDNLLAILKASYFQVTRENSTKIEKTILLSRIQNWLGRWSLVTSPGATVNVLHWSIDPNSVACNGCPFSKTWADSAKTLKIFRCRIKPGRSWPFSFFLTWIGARDLWKRS